MVLSASVGNRLLLRFFGPRQSVQVIAVRTALVVLALPLGLTEQVSHLRHIAPETLRRLALDWCHVQRGSARVAARGLPPATCVCVAVGLRSVTDALPARFRCGFRVRTRPRAFPHQSFWSVFGQTWEHGRDSIFSTQS